MASPNKQISGEYPGLSGERWLHRISAREAAIMIGLAAAVGLASGVSAVVLSMSVHTAIGWITAPFPTNTSFLLPRRPLGSSMVPSIPWWPVALKSSVI